jgi:transcriptional regulator with GAF, ATPase, and Fis domain
VENGILSEYFQPDNARLFRVTSKSQPGKRVDLALKEEAFIDIDFDLFISQLSSKLIHYTSNELDRAIEETLQTLVSLLQVDRASLFVEEENDGEKVLVTCIKTPESGDQSSLTKVILNENNESWFRAFLKSDKKYQELRTEYSSISIPLSDANKIFGILAIGIDQALNWPQELKSRLYILGQLLSSSLMRRRSEQKLHKTLQELEQTKASLHQEKNFNSEKRRISFLAKGIKQSKAMSDILLKAEQVAGTNATVLLSGETGTGKEVIALAIHEMSSRSNKMMVRVNCGAIPSALVESEMFGREKGAYTGALSKQIGRFELADQSTIFLDEVTELPMEVQVKLLRVLQEKEIERLGNPKPIHVDVRIIAASNQNIEKAVGDGKFRQDLYYRLNVFPIKIPPLRERREDIPMLLWSIVDELSQELGKKVETISTKSLEALMEYAWPGNVRELRNVVERAMIVSNSPELNVEIPKTNSANTITSTLTLREMEIEHIRKVLENAGWKIRGKQGAAELLGMKPTTLETRMTKLGIIRPQNKVRL